MPVFTKYYRDSLKESAGAQVAKTIMNQIGRKALFMIGAKNFAYEGNTLHFRIGKNPGSGKGKSVNAIRITLEPTDTYTMEFLRTRGSSVKTIAKVEDVYADNLRSVIRKHTGMATSL